MHPYFIRIINMNINQPVIVSAYFEISENSLRRKKSPVSGHRSASKSVRWRAFFSAIFFLPAGKYVTHCIRGDQRSHIIRSMVAKRGLTNQANVHTTMWKKSFKAQHGRIPIDPAIFDAIGHRFVAGLMRRRVRRPETRDLFGGPKVFRIHSNVKLLSPEVENAFSK